MRNRQGKGWFALVAVSLALAGCHTSTFPDPNNPSTAGDLQPDVLRSQLKGASDALYERRLSGEITERQYQDYLAKFADDLVKSTKLEAIAPDQAWEYGQVFRTARLWKQAETLFRIAVKAAKAEKNEDRRVNDSLWLAQALANEGKVEEAIQVSRSTFSTPAATKVPILYGVLLEIAPAARGKGSDLALAHLLEDAIAQSNQNVVDARTEEGKAFLMALPHHQRNARRLAAELYLSTGKSADAERVLSGKLPGLRV